MSLKGQITDAMKAAMKSKDELRLGALRSVRAEILKKEKEKAGTEADDAMVEQVITRLVKQRRESIEMFEQGGRTEMAEREKAELAVLEEFMPEALGEDEIDTIVKAVIEQTGAAGPSDLGKVMGPIMGKCKATGKTVDGKMVNQRVRALLGA